MKGKYNRYQSFNPLDIKPTWILRWGITVAFLSLILIILFSSFVSYNDVVEGEALVTSRNPPSHIKAKRAGRIQSILIQPGDSISAGEILAIIENIASYSDVMQLKGKVAGDLPVFSTVEGLITEFPQQLNLSGSIQQSYNKFIQAYQEIILDSTYNENLIAIELLSNNLKNQQEKSAIRAQELEVAERNIQNLKMNLNRNKELFSKGIISQAELEKVENEYLNNMSSYFAIKEDVVDTEEASNFAIKNRQALSSKSSRNTEYKVAQLKLVQQVLRSEILNWEEEFLLKSPVEGKLSFNNVWGNFQNVESGETIFTVVPFETNGFIGKCIVPVQNSGKIKQGHRVFLKLHNYPYREWGYVKATVASISEVAGNLENPGFMVYLNVDDIKTSFGRTIEYNRELIGTAEILLEEVSLFERFFYRFTHLLSTTK